MFQVPSTVLHFINGTVSQLLWAYVAKHVQLLLRLFPACFFLSGVLWNREFPGTASFKSSFSATC